MKSMIKELWHGNINPQEDSRNNSPEMKELMEYMARHHDDLLKIMTDEQKRYSRGFMTVGVSTQASRTKHYLNMHLSWGCRLQLKR